MCSALSPPRSEPRFREPAPPEGLRGSSLLYRAHVLCNRVSEALSRARDQGSNAEHVPSVCFFCPRLNYKQGRDGGVEKAGLRLI